MISSFHLTALFSGGWRALLLALFSGVLIALSFPLPGLAPLAWIALIPLLIALEGQTPAAGFRLGFITGFTAYCGLLYWVTIVMTTYGNLPWLVSVALWWLLAAWLAAFYGLTAWAAVFGKQRGCKWVVLLPLAWVAADYLRGILLTGFPWTMLGHSQYRLLPLIQVADTTGVYGITALIVLANVVFYRILRALAGTDIQYPAKSALLLVVALAVTFWHGFHRLNRPLPETTPFRVALIQGNIDQSIKWSPAFQNETINIYSSLSRQAARRGPLDLVIWPESAAPFFFQEPSPAAEQIRQVSRDLKVSLLFGSPAVEIRNGRPAYLNSAFLLDRNGDLLGRSDKMHLVPFGEYVPLSRLLPFVQKLVHGIGDFVPGKEARPLRTDSAPLGVLVCYEAIFPELARRHINNGSRVLVNITNDAWFGHSSAPWQHLSMAAFRAVETRTPLVRAANTGITSIVDQNGHIRGMTSLFKEAIMLGEIHPGSADAPYLKLGDLFAQGCLASTILILLVQWWRGRRQATTQTP